MLDAGFEFRGDLDRDIHAGTFCGQDRHYVVTEFVDYAREHGRICHHVPLEKAPRPKRCGC